MECVDFLAAPPWGNIITPKLKNWYHRNQVWKHWHPATIVQFKQASTTLRVFQPAIHPTKHVYLLMAKITVAWKDLWCGPFVSRLKLPSLRLGCHGTANVDSTRNPSRFQDSCSIICFLLSHAVRPPLWPAQRYFEREQQRPLWKTPPNWTLHNPAKDPQLEQTTKVLRRNPLQIRAAYPDHAKSFMIRWAAHDLREFVRILYLRFSHVCRKSFVLQELLQRRIIKDSEDGTVEKNETAANQWVYITLMIRTSGVANLHGQPMKMTLPTKMQHQSLANHQPLTKLYVCINFIMKLSTAALWCFFRSTWHQRVTRRSSAWS